MDHWGGLGWIFMLLLWGLVILAIAALLKWLFASLPGDRAKSPLEILDERYARGEMDHEEYEQKKQDLQN